MPTPSTPSTPRRTTDTPFDHRHDEKLDYTTEHTGADPETVIREEFVDNDDKALPTNKNRSLFISIAAAVLSILAIILAFVMDLDWLGFVVALVALLGAVLATMMAWNDARTSPIVPGLVALATAVVAIIVLMDALDAEENAPTPARVLGVDPASDSEALDGDADLGDTTTVDPVVD